MSDCDSPFAANRDVSWSRLAIDCGSLPVTLAAVDLSPSIRPSSTAYDGPPACSVASQ